MRAFIPAAPPRPPSRRRPPGLGTVARGARGACAWALFGAGAGCAFGAEGVGAGPTAAVEGRAGSAGEATEAAGAGAGTGTGGAPGAAAVSTALTYHRDIRPIVEAKCNRCHRQGGIGPFALANYAQVLGHAEGIRREVENGRMPPWMPSATCNTYQGDFSLAAAEKGQLLGWLAAGAPEGEALAGQAEALTPAVSDTGDAFRADLTLTMPARYTLKDQADEYRCFLMPYDASRERFVTGGQFTPGNPQVVHHAIVYIIAPEKVASMRSQEGRDGAPGFPCGQSGPSFDWLTSWAPGAGAGTFADGGRVGTRLRAGTGLVMQMHYHAHGDPAATRTDQSRIALQLAEQVEREGHYVQFTNPAWPWGRMPIRAGDPDARASFAAGLVDTYSLFAGGTPSRPVQVHLVAGHMHQRGSKLSLNVSRSGGRAQCLLDIPAWDFAWQNGYRLATPYRVEAGDRVELSCHWDNSPDNQPKAADGSRPAPRDLNWGEGTDDEMCLGFLYMSEQ